MTFFAIYITYLYLDFGHRLYDGQYFWSLVQSDKAVTCSHLSAQIRSVLTEILKMKQYG